MTHMHTGQGEIFPHQIHQAPTALTCPICERPIQPSTKFCSHCSAAILRRYCPGCARLVPDATEICPYCGTPATATPSLKSNRPLVLAASALFLVCVLVWIFSFKSTSTHQEMTPSIVQERPAHAVPVQPVHLSSPAKTAQAPVSATKDSSAISEGEQLNYKGHLLLQNRQFAEAVSVLRIATTKLKNTGSPAYGYALFNLGQSLRLSGNSAEAVGVLEEALKLIPEKDMAQRELTRARVAAQQNAPAAVPDM